MVCWMAACLSLGDPLTTDIRPDNKMGHWGQTGETLKDNSPQGKATHSGPHIKKMAQKKIKENINSQSHLIHTLYYELQLDLQHFIFISLFYILHTVYLQLKVMSFMRDGEKDGLL